MLFVRGRARQGRSWHTMRRAGGGGDSPHGIKGVSREFEDDRICPVYYRLWFVERQDTLKSWIQIYKCVSHPKFCMFWIYGL